MASDLEDRLRSHSTFFASMVELIPPKHYVVKDDSSQVVESGKFWQNKRRKAPKEAIKAASKKAKRAKLDPEKQRSAHKLQQDRNEREGGSEGEDEDVVMGESVGFEVENAESSVHLGVKNGFSVEKVPSAGLSELREKLQNKISELRMKRKVTDSDLDSEEREKKKQKMTEKRERRREMKRIKVRKQAEKSVAAGVSSKPSEAPGGIRFSKLEFPVKKHQKVKRKDLKKMLAKAEEKQQKMEQLKEKDVAMATEAEERRQWHRALEMAKGVKLKDDPHLLKMTIKRKEKKRSRSRKKWSERKNQVEEMKEKRQETRKKHIQERVKLIQAKKMKKRMKKKGVKLRK